MKTKLLFLITTIVTITINAQTTFANKVVIDANTGNNPYTISNGLIDGDSHLDILVGTDVDHIIVWYKGNGDGTFTKQTAITNTLTNIGGLKLADLNGDGYNDIIASGFGSYAPASYGSGSKLVWFQNDGSGNFGSEQLITNAYSGISGLFVGNINAGTTIDVAFTSSVGGEVLWLSNNGSGVFSAATNSSIDISLNSPGVINMKDIDDDGDLDAIVATAAYANDVIEIFRNDLVPGGTVNFIKDANSVTTGKTGIFNANFVDLDGDNNLDILATEISYGGGPSGNLYWYEDNGSSFTETVFTTTTNNPAVAQAQDLDNDGNVDIILSSGALSDVADLVWFKNNGDGTFADEEVINDTQSQVYVYNVADFDGDTDLDIASCEYGADTLSYVANELFTLSKPNFENSIIKIYPNPTKDILNFEGFTTAAEVSIYDVLGKQILKTSITNGKTINVAELLSGIYLIEIDGKFASKFIKE